eukprot:g13704.t1
MYRMPRATFDKLADLLAPLLTKNAHFAELRTLNGCISHKIRLAIGLRILADGSYFDAAEMFGVALPTVYETLWLLIDAINSTQEIGPFFFPQSEVDCRGHAAQFKRQSTNEVLDSCVACVDGLFVKTHAPSPSDTADVLGYYSGMPSITTGAKKDWAAWNRSKLSAAVSSLLKGYYVLGDAAYPLSEKLLTPYPGECLPTGEDSFNFHLSQLRVMIEQSFGILVGTWGILWRPLRVQLSDRTNLITALYHLHNFLQDEKVTPIQPTDEDEESGLGRPALDKQGTLPPEFHTISPKPSRSGETPTRAALRELLVELKQ